MGIAELSPDCIRFLRFADAIREGNVDFIRSELGMNGSEEGFVPFIPFLCQFEYAVEYGQVDVLDVLLRVRPSMIEHAHHWFKIACRENRPGIVRYLLSYDEISLHNVPKDLVACADRWGSDFKYPHHRGRRPLEYACRYLCDASIASMMLKHPTVFDLYDGLIDDMDFRTLFETANKHDHAAVIPVLLNDARIPVPSPKWVETCKPGVRAAIENHPRYKQSFV